MSVILVLERFRQKDYQFEVSLWPCIKIHCYQNKETNKRRENLLSFPIYN